MKITITEMVRFFSEGIWRVSEAEMSPVRRFCFRLLKRLVLATEAFVRDNMSGKAAALTYSSLLSAVPILAIVFAIGRGFGFGSMIEEHIKSSISVSPQFADQIVLFVNSYLDNTQNGIFVGVGLVVLLYTLIQLTSTIEYTFNIVWQVKTPRNIYRRITDYISVFLLLPILIVVSSGLSLFMVTMVRHLPDYQLFSATVRALFDLAPYVLSGLIFTALYMFMPNTRVGFRHAIVPGLLAGSAFQFVQYMYIHSQIWVSTYNAVYGSFAALPLFMLWVQISWFICLYGAELSYAHQNIDSYSFVKDIPNISRRYHDFLMVLVMSRICRRFESGDAQPYTAKELSAENSIPIRLVHRLLDELVNLKMLIELGCEEGDRLTSYMPAEDINHLTVSVLFSRMDEYGNEDLNIDLKDYNKKWSELNNWRAVYLDRMSTVLLKDL